jgi:hypothetical protein
MTRAPWLRRSARGEGREDLDATRAWLREDYSLDTYVARMEQIYENVLSA